jgi:phenylacetic acid degradation operon negative regulatory protein
MGQLRMAELREAVWVRPNNLPPDESQAAHVADAQCTWATGTLDSEPDVDALFGVTDWAAAARELLDELRATAPRLERRDADALGDTFVIAAAATRHLTLDPLLPHELLPEDWPGDELRRVYDAYDAAFAATWRDWYRARS